MAETRKAKPRRLAEGFFAKYVCDPGLDIGCGNDPLNETFRRWDKPDGDAQKMPGVSSGIFKTVYASHILEHLNDPKDALRNWWRILAPGGHLIICVPHRDLYEGKTELPSQFNAEHKTYWLLDRAESPCTLDFTQTLKDSCEGARIVYIKILDAGWQKEPGKHAGGEYAIEAVLYKPFLTG